MYAWACACNMRVCYLYTSSMFIRTFVFGFVVYQSLFLKLSTVRGVYIFISERKYEEREREIKKEIREKIFSFLNPVT